MNNYANEIIEVNAGVNYEPTFIRTDKRRPASETTSLGYHQIGELAQYGNSKSPFIKIEFVDLSGLSSATHVKLWGVENDDTNAPLYTVAYLQNWRPLIDIKLKKFIFCDSAGVEIDETGNYIVLGHKGKVLG